MLARRGVIGYLCDTAWVSLNGQFGGLPPRPLAEMIGRPYIGVTSGRRSRRSDVRRRRSIDAINRPDRQLPNQGPL